MFIHFPDSSNVWWKPHMFLSGAYVAAANHTGACAWGSNHVLLSSTKIGVLKSCFFVSLCAGEIWLIPHWLLVTMWHTQIKKRDQKWWFPEIGVPQVSSIYKWIFHYKPTILREPPFISIYGTPPEIEIGMAPAHRPRLVKFTVAVGTPHVVGKRESESIASCPLTLETPIVLLVCFTQGMGLGVAGTIIDD